MTLSYVVDTDILVDFFRGYEPAIECIKAHSKRISLSVVVLSELYAGTRNSKESEELDTFFRIFPIFPITKDIARRGGLLKQQYSKSHGIGLADALIAATAQHHGLEVMTLNTKHYPMFPGLQPPYTK